MPEPAVRRSHLGELGRQGVVFWIRQAGGEAAPLPPEFVLRNLMDANLDDPGEILDLLNQHGPLIREDSAFQWCTEASGSLPQHGLWLTELEGGSPTILYGPTLSEAAPLDLDQTHLLDIRYHLKLVRALTRHLLNSQEGQPVEDAWAAEFGIAPEHPWAAFSEAITRGLFPFRVRVEYLFDVGGEERSGTAPEADLYSVMCLQVFNLMIEGLPVRHCASETCGRAFFRQIGRAEYGQYRTEGVVRYCSPGCANAQTQRDYRRRKRAEKRNAQ